MIDGVFVLLDPALTRNFLSGILKERDPFFEGIAN